MTKRLCIVPRWGASQDMEWYPWLREQPLVAHGFEAHLGPDIEDRDTPTIAAWLASLQKICGSGDADGLAETYFVAHSVGCQAVLHYLASLPEGVQVAGFLAVAGWWNLDEPWETIQPWVYTDDSPTFDVSRARRACPRTIVLISDNDPFTASWKKTRTEWQERMDATVRVIPGAAHFNSSEAPVVLEALTGLLG